MPTQQELKQQGNTHFQNDDFEKAIEFYTLAIEQDAFCDEAAPILSNRSLCYYNIGKYKEAYEDAGCCCGIRPDWAKGFARRGAAAEKLGEFDIALESYDEYLKLDRSDEMNIKNKQKTAKKIVDGIEKKKREKENELRRIDEELTSMKDGSEEKQIAVYSLLRDAANEMNIEKIELAVKHGVDLGRKWIVDERLDQNMVFSNSLFEQTELFCRNNKDWSGIYTGGIFALLQLIKSRSTIEDSQFEQAALLAKQRDYLDRLLDLVDKQQTKYEPPLKLMNQTLTMFFVSGNRYPFRTDFFLFLNTEKGKKFFVGETISMKRWQLQLVQSMLFAGAWLHKDPTGGVRKRDLEDVRAGKHATTILNPPEGIHLRRILECLEIGLKGMTSRDINEKSFTMFGKEDKVLDRLALLGIANDHCPSPEILEFLLSRGADADADASVRLDIKDGHVAFSYLDRCLHAGYPSCARVLLSYGAKIRTEPLPSCIDPSLFSSLAASSPSSASSMLFPQTAHYPRLGDVINKLTNNDGKDETNQETIKVLFDAMTEQNVSFISFTDSGKLGGVPFTPLTAAIISLLPLKILETMMKARPKLLHTPVPMEGALCYPVAILCHAVPKVEVEYSKSVMALMFDLSGYSYHEFPAVQQIKSSDESAVGLILLTLSQYFSALLRAEERGHHNRNQSKLKEFEEFCVNYGKEKKSSDDQKK